MANSGSAQTPMASAAAAHRIIANSDTANLYMSQQINLLDLQKDAELYMMQVQQETSAMGTHVCSAFVPHANLAQAKETMQRTQLH